MLGLLLMRFPCTEEKRERTAAERKQRTSERPKAPAVLLTLSVVLLGLLLGVWAGRDFNRNYSGGLLLARGAQTASFHP